MPKSYFENQMGLSENFFEGIKNSTNIIQISKIEIA